MPLLTTDAHAIDALILPETDLERRILSVPEFQRGLLWGEPRYGHPEGKVGLHIREVLDNINRIPALSPTDRERLRLVAIAHDTFKYAEDRSRPRDWSKHHGRLARDFLALYTSDKVILDVTEHHDDAYYAWLAVRYEQDWKDGSLRTINHLLEKVGYCIQIYYLFFKCDTQTGDKTQAPLKWFEKTVPGIEVVYF